MQALLYKKLEVSVVAFTDQSGYQRITESHFPGQYLDIALVTGQYKIYCPAMAFDLPTQSVTYTYMDSLAALIHAYVTCTVHACTHTTYVNKWYSTHYENKTTKIVTTSQKYGTCFNLKSKFMVQLLYHIAFKK